jgi:SAM-dependent methyltransferase
MSDGWAESAEAWLALMGEAGDFARRFVLDGPMLERVEAGRFDRALDIGCGEGRFCRMLRARGIAATGIEPTEALLAAARRRDPDGDYRIGRAEALDLPDGRFDLVVSYLSLIDMPDAATATTEMARVLAPGGSLLIANLTGFATAAVGRGWAEAEDGREGWLIDRYLEERGAWVDWRGMRILNWHRPLETYMQLLLGAGLVLVHFAEPAPKGGDAVKAERYWRVPCFVVMEWLKPRG